MCLSLFITDHCKETQQKKSMVTHTHTLTHPHIRSDINEIMWHISVSIVEQSRKKKEILEENLTNVFDLQCCMLLGLVYIVEQYLGQVDPRPRKLRFSKKRFSSAYIRIRIA